METTTNKMQWFIDDYQNNKLKHVIAKTKYNYGVVKQPTGTGKSSVIYEDIITRVSEHNKKQIFIICSHILNLNEQTYNNLYQINDGIHFLDNYKTCVILNSSVSDDQYKKMTYNTHANIIRDLSLIESFNESDFDIAFVSSCNDSFDKLWNLKYNKDVEIICYIDECHNLVSKLDNIKMYEKFRKFCKSCKCVYGLSATPSKFVKIINDINNKTINKKYLGNEQCIYNMSADEAIKNNLIVKPYIKTIHTSDGQITSNVILNIMKDAKKSNSASIHKILVTCFSINEVEKLYNECSQYYKCFKNTSNDDWKITEFCEEVDNCKEDCVIFHCRKLIQGIDIQSITDAIISNNANQDADRDNRIIQIIGRALRTARGEYGFNINMRNKKFANIYFVSNGNEEYDNAIARLVIKYYGLNNIIINNNEILNDVSNGLKNIYNTQNRDNKNNSRNTFNKIQHEINVLKVNFKKYIEDDIINNYNKLISNGAYIDINDILDSIEWGALSNDVDTINMFTNIERINIIKETFAKHNIKL